MSKFIEFQKRSFYGIIIILKLEHTTVRTTNVITDVIVMFVHSNLILEYIQAQPIYTFVEFYVRDDGKY